MAGCSPSVKDDKDKSAVYLNDCRRMGIKVLPPNVNESEAELRRTGRRRDPLRPVGGAQRRHQRRRVDHQVPQGQGEVHVLPGLPRQGRRGRLQQARHGVADQGGCLRLPGPHPQGPHRPVRADDIDDVDGRRGSRSTSSAAWARRRTASPASASTYHFTDDEWDKTYLLAQEREMLHYIFYDHPLFGLERVLSSRPKRGMFQLTAATSATARWSPSAASSRPAAADDQAGQRLGDRRRWRTSRADRGTMSPATLQDWYRRENVADAVVFVKGRRQAGGRAAPGGDGADGSRPVQRGHQRARRPHHPGDA
ncbi:DNA polymerase III subunit alpha [Streptomyces tanashiensis]